MSNRATYVKQSTTLVIALSCIALSSIGGADSVVAKKKPANIADQELFFAPVPKAVCGPGDKPETGLQGQVPAPLRMQPGGFQGFSCNLQLVAQAKGDGAGWTAAEWREGRGKNRRVCAYHGTASPPGSYEPYGDLGFTFSGLARDHYGTRVVDLSDPAKPSNTAYLSSVAMIDPWKSLKANHRRQLLAGVNGGNGAGGNQIDIYDVSGDCRYPQLLASTPMLPPYALRIMGHEGNWAPDGLTYYAADNTTALPGAPSIGSYYAIDTTDTTKPTFLTFWTIPVPGARHHGLTVNDDGTRGYFSSSGSLPAGGLIDPNVPATNGLLIYDLSEIQARKANPQVKEISRLLWKDGSTAQMAILVRIKGKPYIVFTDENGSSGARALGCPAGIAVDGMARIIDISDEKNPRIASKLMLEAADPANCAITATDGPGTKSSHYCSVDNKYNATTLACSYRANGIRVFDIRDPIRPREIAYYNPPAVTTRSPGANSGNNDGGPDQCSAQVYLDASLGTLWTTCQQNGLLSFKFMHNAWPFADSTTPPGMQN